MLEEEEREMEDGKKEEVGKKEETKKTKEKQQTKKPKIAAIKIRQKKLWIQTSKQLREIRINYMKARVVKNGVEIELDKEDDYRKINAFLKKKNVEFYTFDLLKRILHEML